MKRFILRTIVYSFLLLVLCFGLQWMADKGLRKSASNDFKNWTRIVEGQINADLLVTGSSRAMRMIDPKILADGMGER